MRLLCLILTFQFHMGSSYKILGIMPLASKSHFVMFERLFKGLAEKGHEVDVVSHFPLKKSFPRYNDLSILGSLPIFVNNLSISTVGNLSTMETAHFMITKGGIDCCKALFGSDVAKKLRDSTKQYDLLMTEIFGTDCPLGFAHHFKIPVVALTTSVSLPWGNDRIGNPDNPSYIPNYFSPYLNQMSLTERFFNTILLVSTKIMYDEISVKQSNVMAKQFFGPDLPDLRELVYNTSLLLINSHFSINGARPLVTNFIEVGGLHIEKQKPLSEYFRNIIENSNGIIYFSMGSMVMTETFSVDKLQSFLSAFAELKFYTVLWKAMKDKLPKELIIPENVHFETWMPQHDILCHPKVKLFITHGGLMGTQEAIKCGVPRLGIPLFADQELNIRQSVVMNLAIEVSYDNITKESILTTAKELLTNSKYKKNAEEVSKLFTDRQSTPLDTAIYWVEYVIRHKGAPHLKSAATLLPFYQYFLLDLIIIFIILTVLTLWSAYYITYYFAVVLLCGSKKKLKKQ